MAGYFGTETQQRPQAQAEASVDFINLTPGACHTGRTMGCDDPDRLGWERITECLDRDGVCGFRLIPTGKVNELKSPLIKRDYRFDTWDVFLADRATLAASEVILSRRLPDGLTEMERPTDPESEYTGRIQALLGAASVVPFWLPERWGGRRLWLSATRMGVSWRLRMATSRTTPTAHITAMSGVGLSPWQSHSGARASATTSTPA